MLYLQTTKGAPEGRVVAVPAANPDREAWRDLVPEREDAVIEAVTFGQGVIAVTYLTNASNVIEVFDLEGRSLGVLRSPVSAPRAVSAEPDRTEAYLTFTSFNHPTGIFRVDLVAADGRARALGEAGCAGRSVDRRGRAGVVSVEGRDEGQHVPRPQHGS